MSICDAQEFSLDLSIVDDRELDGGEKMGCRSLKLWFDGDCPELVQTEFQFSADSPERTAIRGKTSGAHMLAQSFQWSAAVQALAVLILEYVSASSDQSVPVISGGRGSLAMSLDYAIQKQTNSLCEIFGTDSTGGPVISRLLLRTNSCRKRPGPVSIGVNHHALPRANIQVLFRNRIVSDAVQLQQMANAIRSKAVLPLPRSSFPTRGGQHAAGNDRRPIRLAIVPFPGASEEQLPAVRLKSLSEKLVAYASKAEGLAIISSSVAREMCGVSGRMLSMADELRADIVISLSVHSADPNPMVFLEVVDMKSHVILLADMHPLEEDAASAIWNSVCSVVTAEGGCSEAA